MKFLINCLLAIGSVVALPFSLLAGTFQTVTLDVQNMTCAVCPITVKKALERVPGVTDARVDFDKKTARVSFDPEKNDSCCADQSNNRCRLSFLFPQLN